MHSRSERWGHGERSARGQRGGQDQSEIPFEQGGTNFKWSDLFYSETLTEIVREIIDMEEELICVV